MLEFRDIIKVRVRAHNEFGWGSLSNENTSQAIYRVPQKVQNLSRGSASNRLQIEVLWDALTTSDEKGDTDILGYMLERETSADVWESVATTTNLNYTVTTNIVQGTEYTFRVTARNIEGWGTPSDEFTFLAAEAPPQMSQVTTAIIDANVKVSWVAPDNYGSPITSYTILFRDSLNNYITEASCLGDNTTIRDQLY